jgi:hypothetical protein
MILRNTWGWLRMKIRKQGQSNSDSLIFPFLYACSPTLRRIITARDKLMLNSLTRKANYYVMKQNIFLRLLRPLHIRTVFKVSEAESRLTNLDSCKERCYLIWRYFFKFDFVRQFHMRRKYEQWFVLNRLSVFSTPRLTFCHRNLSFKF